MAGGWKPRARKSFGNKYVRLNLSKTGVGWSVGVPGARRTHRADGRVVDTVGIPGTGLGMQRTVKGTHRATEHDTRSAWMAKVQEAGADVDERFTVIKTAIEAQDDDTIRAGIVLHAGALIEFRDALGAYPAAEAARDRVQWFCSVADYVIATADRLCSTDAAHEDEVANQWAEAIARLEEGYTVLGEALQQA